MSSLEFKGKYKADDINLEVTAYDLCLKLGDKIGLLGGLCCYKGKRQWSTGLLPGLRIIRE